MPTRRQVLAALCVPLATVPSRLRAQPAWAPSRPVEIIVMAGPGGGADLAAKFLIKIIEENDWSPVPFTTRNLPGGSGLEALAECERRRGDDHVLLFTLNSFYTSPLANPAAKIDVTRFAPVARLAEDPFLLWINADRTDIEDFDDLTAAMRAAGDAWTMGGTGVGSEDQLLTDFLNSSYGLKLRYRAFDGGGEVASALSRNEVQSTVNNPSEAARYLAAGKVKPLAAFTQQRLPAFRRVPALRETGMNFTYFMQRTITGPPDMPAPALKFYVELFEKIYDSHDWQTYRRRNSLIGNLLTGQELTAYWLRELELHRRWIEAMKAMSR